MSKEKIRDLIICVLAIGVLILAVTTNVFAIDNIETLNTINNNSEENLFTTIGERNNTTNSNVNTNTNTNVNTNTNNAIANNSNVNKTAIPYTGVDYSVIVIIAICGISAIYAYKKISDYKSL